MEYAVSEWLIGCGSYVGECIGDDTHGGSSAVECSTMGVAVVTEGEKLITVTEKGYGTRTDFDDFRLMKNRGGHGVVCHNLSEKTGKLCGIAAVDDEDDIMMITDSGTIIRTPAADIPRYSRSAGGVIVMRLAEGQSLVNFTKVHKEEAEEESDIIDTDTAPATDAAETTEE